MRIPLGVDIAEVWEVDYCSDVGRSDVESWREVLAKAREAEDAEKVAAAERGLAAAEAELAGYQAGAGPVFVVGHIPGAKRAEIAGMMADVREAKTERERFPAEQAWRREVVRWAVRGHRGLRRRDGTEQAFDGVSVTLAGETFTQPSERQLERYIAAGMLAGLCMVALRPQGMDGAEKNG